mmetsp:Transcript_53666/g.61513  ORF Transcript_53666/g.61513 Transcript_53666/m.61513 type:complete len:114 (+) Transcript_53666:712-1053(+)
MIELTALFLSRHESTRKDDEIQRVRISYEKKFAKATLIRAEMGKIKDMLVAEIGQLGLCHQLIESELSKHRFDRSGQRPGLNYDSSSQIGEQLKRSIVRLEQQICRAVGEAEA